MLTSPLLRARETARSSPARSAASRSPTSGWRPAQRRRLLRAAVAGRGDEVVVVGHQPDCGRIAAELSGGAEPAFPPAGLVVLEL